jgi:hypothetical protein
LVIAKSQEPTGEIVLYQTDDGRTRVECRFAEETLWLSQALMAELFQTTPQNITLHLTRDLRSVALLAPSRPSAQLQMG